MIKTEKQAAQAGPRSRAKFRRVKAKATKALSGLKTARKVRRKAKPAETLDSFDVRTRLARLEAPRESMSRLEARIPSDLYKVMERAAQLRGLTMTAYVTATMGEDARRTIEQTSIIRLSQADQVAFAEALINPAAPNAKLVAAAKRHSPMMRK